MIPRTRTCTTPASSKPRTTIPRRSNPAHSCSLGLLAGLLLLVAASPLFADLQEFIRSQMLTLDVEVLSMTELAAEGELAVVALTVTSEERPDQQLELLLAPPMALLQAGIEIEVGHRLRVRVFPDNEGPLLVHKLWNLSTRAEARLRTLHQIPVWNEAGNWQGSERQNCPYNPWPRQALETDPATATPGAEPTDPDEGSGEGGS